MSFDEILEQMDESFLLERMSVLGKNSVACTKEAQTMIDDQAPALRGVLTVANAIFGDGTVTGVCIALWLVKQCEEVREEPVGWLGKVLAVMDEPWCIHQIARLVYKQREFVEQSGEFIQRHTPALAEQLSAFGVSFGRDVVMGILVLIEFLRTADETCRSEEKPPSWFPESVRDNW